MKLYLFSTFEEGKNHPLIKKLKSKYKHKFKISCLYLDYEQSEALDKVEVFKSIGAICTFYDLYSKGIEEHFKDIYCNDFICFLCKNPKNLVDRLKNKDMQLLLNNLNKSNTGIILEGEATKICGPETWWEFIKEFPLKKSGGRALNITDFYFIPNWEENKQYLYKFIDLSSAKKDIYYGCDKRCGIAIEDSKIYFYGDVIEISKGRTSIYNGERRII
ncbi:hypothetical protein [Clostridium fallax]|uniref:Uncharacterized protein n=1 Tax=Clostridium fallax TaxID=1533 RepID=A0A1M4YZQ6_9CLOT|nr:hypothetical protein [Clostridium fallax]SHF11281.1 hypothetical protein SAMN05443638_13424 [Clostridium fallax]SQB07365.1 Uncharacterised protein [Clostridium fallax]